MRVCFNVGYGTTSNGESLAVRLKANYFPATVESLIELARIETCKIFGGCFVSFGLGGWIDPANGKLVTESAIEIAVETVDSIPNRDRIAPHAVYLRDLFLQSSVLVSVSESNVQFI